MRPSLVIVVTLSLCVLAAPAFALQADDTMQDWKKASDSERSELLKQLLKGHDGTGAAISRCMTETSAIPDHADLPIGEVAKVCASAGNAGQPV